MIDSFLDNVCYAISKIDYYKDWHKALVIGVVQNVLPFRRYRHSSLQGSCLHFFNR